MARVPRKLTVDFSADSSRDLAEIWEWNREFTRRTSSQQ